MSRASLLVAFLAAGLGAGSAPGAGQTQLAGTVKEVHSSRVLVSLEEAARPALGDSAVLGQRVPGIGRVRLQGRWRVSEMDQAGIWLEPESGGVPASAGNWVRIHASMVTRPSVEAGRAEGPVVLLDRDFETESPSPPTPPPCISSVEEGRFRFSHVGEPGSSCRYVFREVGALDGTARIDIRVRGVEVPQGQTFGLLFGFLDDQPPGAGPSYNLFLVDETGQFKVTRFASGRWADLVVWSEAELLRRGPGAVNDLAVETSPGRARVFANRLLLAEVAAPDQGPGGFGLYLNETGVTLAAEHLRVTQLAASGRTAAPPLRTLVHLDYDGESDRPDADTPTCRTGFQGGTYLVANPPETPNPCAWMLYSTAPRVEGPARFSAKVRPASGPPEEPNGIIFGEVSRGSGEYFVFQVDGRGRYQVVRKTQAGWVTLTPWIRRWEVFSGPGSENELAVELRGSRAHLFVNGFFLMALDLPAPAAGHVGLYVDEPGSSVLFDDIRMVEIG